MEDRSMAQTNPMMSFPDVVKTCLRKYGDFSGRATRAEYWWWVLFTVLTSIALSIVDSIIGYLEGWDHGPLETLFALATLLPSVAVAARRLHDIGKTGWWQLAWYAISVTAWLVAGVMYLIAVGREYAITHATGDKVSLDFEKIDWANSWEALASFPPAVIVLIAAAVITLAVIVWAIVWMVRQGEPGPNRHGSDPRASDPAAQEELP